MGKERGGDDTDPTQAWDHLANERTYLAWLRTSTNVMALGLAMAKFIEIPPYPVTGRRSSADGGRRGRAGLHPSALPTSDRNGCAPSAGPEDHRQQASY
ncbi:YidH family protein [Streptomyces sp. NPDC056352]|uniref:YidH family protein n=1 Tax=Streptomyces sp. NPDC056352 TaxID=3345791 RepID=UPI0035D723BE